MSHVISFILGAICGCFAGFFVLGLLANSRGNIDEEQGEDIHSDAL